MRGSPTLTDVAFALRFVILSRVEPTPGTGKGTPVNFTEFPLTLCARNAFTPGCTGAVGSFNSAMAAPGSFRTRPTVDAYRRDAIAAVVGVTRQRVARLESSHDEATDVATETFTLERHRRSR